VTGISNPPPTGARDAYSPRKGFNPVYRMPTARNYVVVGFYLVLLVALFFLRGLVGLDIVLLLIAILLVYFARELSIRYVLTDDDLIAWRIFGWRRIPLATIRRVDRASLRELSPVSFFGTWGWRSRMWSPVIGRFDNVSGYHAGLLVYGQGAPLFISPADPAAFAQELVSRTGVEPVQWPSATKQGLASLV
jgi:hypothetical protein